MKKIKKLIVVTLVLCMAMGICSFAASAEGGTIAWGAATVDASSLNIRSGPSLDADRVGIVAGGTIIVIIEQTNDEWYKINYAGTVGYVSTEYLTEILKAENFRATGVINGTDVRMRSGPSTSHDIMGVFNTGDKMSIIGINNGWYKVNTDKGTGYIRSDFIDITGGGPVHTSAPATTTSSDTASSGARSSDPEVAESNAKSPIGQQIANFALQYVGYPYVYSQESPSKGFDCSGLVYYVYGHFGYKLERRASLQCAKNGWAVKKSELKQGDLLFFSADGSSVSHVGIYIGDGQFVHASTSRTGVIISELNSTYYTQHYYAARRIVE